MARAQGTPRAPRCRVLRSVAVGRVPTRPLPDVRRRRTVAHVQQAKTVTSEVLSVELQSTDVLRTVDFQLVAEGRGQALQISYVAAGSEAEQAGVRVGQVLRGISDPVRTSELLRLGDAPSARFVRSALQMRRAPYTVLELSPGTAAAVRAPTAPAAPVPAPEPVPASTRAEPRVTDSLDMLLGTSSDEEELPAARTQGAQAGPVVWVSIARLRAAVAAAEAQVQAQLGNSGRLGLPAGSTVADVLALWYREYAKRDQQRTEVMERMSRRKDYLQDVSQRNDAGFFGTVFAFFVLPAAIILTLAYTSGYLDKLYMSSLTIG